MDSFVRLFNRGRNAFPVEKRSPLVTFLLVAATATLDNANVAGAITTFFSVAEKFNTSFTTVSWVLSGYSLTLGAFIIIGGKFADVFGAANVFIISCFCMSIFALLTAVVDNIIAIIVFRAFQGITGAFLVPTSFAFIGGIFPPEKVAFGISMILIAMTTSLGIGTTLGGAFSLTSTGYKGLFYFTFAGALTGSVCLYFFGCVIPKSEEHQKLKVKNLDFTGAVFLVIGMLLIILGLTEGGTSWKSASAYVPLPVGFAIVVGVLLYETVYIQYFKDKYNREIQSDRERQITPESIRDWRYHVELLFPREILTLPNFLPYLFSTFLSYCSYLVLMGAAIQSYMYLNLDSPLLAALKGLPISIGLGFGSAIYRPWMAEKLGNKLILVMSPVLTLASSIWCSRTDFRIHNSYWKFDCFSLFLFGFGCSLFYDIYWNIVFSTAPVHLRGLITGIFMTGAQIGICLGNAGVATIVGDLSLAHTFEEKLALHHKFQNCFYFSMALCVAFLVAMIIVKVEKPKVSSDTETETQTIQAAENFEAEKKVTESTT